MRRFVALLQGLPASEAAVWRHERDTARARREAPAPPVQPIRKVSPFEAMQMLRGA